MKQNEFDIEALVKKQNPREKLKELVGNGIYLSKEEQHILEKYQFPYQNYSHLKSLIFDIEDYINENYQEDLEDLEQVLDSLAEFDYYQNTNQ